MCRNISKKLILRGDGFWNFQVLSGFCIFQRKKGKESLLGTVTTVLHHPFVGQKGDPFVDTDIFPVDIMIMHHDVLG